MASLRQAGAKSAAIFLGRLTGAALLFAAQLAISRLWGAETLGQYLLFVAAINLIALVLPLGFQIVGGYFAADYAARGQGRALRRFAALSFAHIAVMTVLLAILASLLPAPATDWLETLAAGRLAVIVGAAGLAATMVSGALLVGLRRPILSYAPDALVRPAGVVLVVAAAAWFGGESPLGFLVAGLAAILAVNGIVLLGAALRSLAAVPPGGDEGRSGYRRWWRFALPWVVIVAATEAMFDLDLVLLAGHLAPAELAVFGVCGRFFVLAAFGIGAVWSVMLPDLFDAEARADQGALSARLGQANLVAVAVAVASFLGAAIGGPFVLGLFGPGFAAGYPALLIVFGGLVVRALFGPASLVVSLRERPYANLPVAAAGLAVLGLGNLALVEPFGLTGAGIAALGAIAVWSAGWWAVARRITGMDVSILGRLVAARRLPEGAAGERRASAEAARA